MTKEIFLYSGIYSFTAENFNRQISESEGEDITLRVSSGGGSVIAGWAMIAKLNEHKGNITTKVDGIAASMAAFFLPYSNRVEASEVARIMVHRADGPVNTEEQRQLLAGINKDLRAQFAKRIDEEKFKTVTGKSFNDVFDPEKRINVWLTAAEAKKVGLVDEVIKLDSRDKATAEAMIESVAASLNYETPEIIAGNDSTFNNNQNKTQSMNIADFKATHPAIFAEVLAQGVTEGIATERDRVGAFMAFAHLDLDATKAGIEEGKNMSQKFTAEMTVKAINVKAVVDMGADATEDLNPAGEGQGTKETEAAKKEAKELADFEAELETELNK